MTSPTATSFDPAARELNLLTILLAFRRGWVFVLVACLIGAALGWTAGKVIAPTYEAIAIVRMAKVAQIEGEKVVSMPVESVVQAAERARTPAFLRGNRSLRQDESIAALGKRISARQIRDAELLELRYRDDTAEGAVTGVRAVFELLKARQDELAAPARQQVQAQLAAVQQYRQEARGGNANGAGAGGSALQLAFVGRENDLLRWEMSLRSALNPPSTLPTTLMENIETSDAPVGPGAGLLAAAGLLAGLLLGCLLAVLRYVQLAR